ncbi:unnamed protein product [Rotaria socialis]|uniref:Uncharacterized protein n=1 Tax=Rotaria socialis TaxID=392032 RepID=A0A820VT85_9BILA|nr:unnamed protein product [Rotaria socialis]
MQKILGPIVVRLKELQKPKMYQISNIQYEIVRVYLIGICNGECKLASLAFIDRGSSFMSDTLHSIYHGAFSCLKAQYYQQMIFSRSKIFTNAAIVYKYMGAINYRKIRKIYYASQQNQHFWAIQPLQNTCYDTLNIEGQVFINENVIFGNILSNEMHLISFEHVIEKACYYERDDLYYFTRFPNLHESS